MNLPKRIFFVLSLLVVLLTGRASADKASDKWLPCPPTASPWKDAVTFDRSRLAEMEPLDAIAAYWGQVAAFKYTGRKGDFTKQLDEAAEWLARNPKIRRYFEDFFEQNPPLVENSNDRHSMFSILDELPAEWALQLLAKLALDPHPIVSREMTHEEILEYWTTGGLVVRNDTTACSIMLESGLAGAPYHDYMTKSTHEEILEWIRANQHRLGEVARNTWGERAVLNSDLEPGGGEAGGKPETASANPASRPSRLPSADKDAGNLAVPTWPVAAALATAVLLAALALRFLRRPSGDGDPK